MRPLHPTDISIAARALLMVPADQRIDFADRLVMEAEAADKFRKNDGHAHARMGNGSLESAARAYPLADPRPLGDRENLACWETMLASIGRKAESL